MSRTKFSHTVEGSRLTLLEKGPKASFSHLNTKAIVLTEDNKRHEKEKYDTIFFLDVIFERVNI